MKTINAMILNNTDKTLRDELTKLQDLPDEVKWNAEYGWKQYKKKYVSKINRKLIYWSAAAVAVFFFSLFFIKKSIVPSEEFPSTKKTYRRSFG